MKLFSHNFLICHSKSCTKKKTALKLVNPVTEIEEATYNPEFIRVMLDRLSWPALQSAASDLNISGIYIYMYIKYNIYYIDILMSILCEFKKQYVNSKQNVS